MRYCVETSGEEFYVSVISEVKTKNKTVKSKQHSPLNLTVSRHTWLFFFAASGQPPPASPQRVDPANAKPQQFLIVFSSTAAVFCSTAPLPLPIPCLPTLPPMSVLQDVTAGR